MYLAIDGCGIVRMLNVYPAVILVESSKCRVACLFHPGPALEETSKEPKTVVRLKPPDESPGLI
jgi:hypothetical protein